MFLTEAGIQEYVDRREVRWVQGGGRLHPARRTPNLLQSQVCRDVPRTSLGGDYNHQEVLRNDPERFLYKSHVSFPTLLTTQLTSEGQRPGLAYPEFSADPLHVIGAWLTFS